MGALGFVATPAVLARELAAVDAAGGILDPACGEGDLLLAAWRASGCAAEVARRLHGLELDPERARRARRRLRAEIGGHAGEAAARRIRCQDALLDKRRWPARTAVVANPPWVSLSGRQRGDLAPDRENAYRAAFPAMAGWPSLHGAFLERIARHVALEDTIARVLVPDSTCDRERYAPLRAAIGELCEVRWIRHVAERELPDVVESAAVLELVRGRTVGRWEPELQREDARLLEHLAPFPRLPPSCFGDIGVHTGNAARLLVRRGSPTAPEGGEPADGAAHPLREGRDLRPFRLGPPSATLVIPVERPPHLRYRIAPLERHRSIPILVRQTANRPIAARHTHPAHFRNTLLACTPPPGLALEAVVAVLNSDLAARWHRASFADARQETFPQVKIGHLRALPFPWLDRAAAPRRHDELAELGRALEAVGDEGLELVEALDSAVCGAFGL